MGVWAFILCLKTHGMFVCVCLKANEQILHRVPFIRLGLLRDDKPQT